MAPPLRGSGYVEFGGAAAASASDRPTMSVTWTPRYVSAPNQKSEDFPLTDRAQGHLDVATGQFGISSNDLDIAGTGLDFSLNRTFDTTPVDSGNSAQYSSRFDALDSRVYKLGSAYRGLDREAWLSPGGHWYFFQADGSTSDCASAWKQAVGLRARLCGKSDGTWTVTLDSDGTSYQYAASGLPTRIVDKNNDAISFAYDGVAHISTITDTRGRVIHFAYKAGAPLDYGISSGVGIQQITDSSNRSLTYTLNGDWQIDSFRDAASNLTQYTYDSAKRLIKITTPGGRALALSYDATNKINQVRELRNGTSAATGDPTWGYSYGDGKGTCSDATTIGYSISTDPNGNRTTYCHDVLDQVVQVIDARGNSTDSNYDPMGNVVKASSLYGTANAASSTFTFDSSSRPMGSKAPTGEQTSTHYDNTAQATKYLPTQQTDEQGTSQYLDYDPVGNLTGVRDRSDANATGINSIKLTYDSAHANQLKTSKLGSKPTTSYSYDAANQLQAISPPVPLAQTTFTYDSLSRVKTITDGRGITKTLGYDPLDRITSVTLSGAATGSFSFTYDPDGYLTERQDSTGNDSTYETNSVGQRVAEHFPGNQTNAYRYDGEGNLLSLTDPANQTTSYHYDQLNRVVQAIAPNRLTGSTADTITFNYADRGNGKPATITSGIYADGNDPNVPTGQPNIYKTTETFDESGKPTGVVARDAAGIANSASVGPVVDLSYSYRDSSNTARAKLQSQTLNGKTTTYAYADNGTSRLIKAASASPEQTTYDYDDAGNRTTKAVTGADGSTATTKSLFNDDNQLCWSVQATSTSATCDAPPPGTTRRTYDANGNLTATASQSFTYDGYDRLTSNGLKYLSPNNGELIADGTTTFQNATLGVMKATSLLSATAYTRAPDGTPLAQRTGSDKQFYVSDRNGSTLALISDQGSVVRTIRYDPRRQRDHQHRLRTQPAHPLGRRPSNQRRLPLRRPLLRPPDRALDSAGSASADR